MKTDRQTIYLVAGLGMIVGAFFAAAKAAGGILSIIFLLAATGVKTTDPSTADNIFTTLKAGHISSSVHGIGSCLILFFGARWMLRGPRLIDRWIDRGKDSVQTDSEPAQRDEITTSKTVE